MEFNPICCTFCKIVSIVETNLADVPQAGVPQVLILGPLLFLIFINDLQENLICNPILFADVSLNVVMHGDNLSNESLKKYLKLIHDWSIK